jgi:membrane protease subunit HflK
MLSLSISIKENLMPNDNDDPPGDPWGGNNRSPPDIDRLLIKNIDHVKKLLSGGSPTSFFIIFALVFSGLLVWTALYTVPSDSVAVVQRFGKYVHDVPPGLHLKFPLGIDSATIVPVKRQLKQEFGFSTPGATDPYQSARTYDHNRETQMVTGDLNAACAKSWVTARSMR